MSAPQFFVSSPCDVATEVPLDREDVHHAVAVLRLRAGDEIDVVARRRRWHGAVVDAAKGAVVVRIRAAATESDSETPVDLRLLQALPKGDKMDFVVEKAVELGVHTIVPVTTARSYGDVSTHKLTRWRKIARAAAMQSKRLLIPEITPAATWSEAIAAGKNGHTLLLADETAPAGSLQQALAGADDGLAIAIGPEGSFTPEEFAHARSAGARSVSLGPRILRTETAALAMLAAIAALKRWW